VFEIENEVVRVTISRHLPEGYPERSDFATWEWTVDSMLPGTKYWQLDSGDDLGHGLTPDSLEAIAEAVRKAEAHAAEVVS
jgi:hypothetical protein